MPRLAKDRRVIALEAQGHGHTADRAAPLSEEQLVSDAAAVLDSLGVTQADFVGHSMGAMVAGGIAIRRRDLVRSLVLLSRHATPDGLLPELLAMQGDPQHVPSPELVAILPTQSEFGAWAEHYQRVAPNPAAFQDVAMKVQALMANWKGWGLDQLRGITAPTLVAIGDRDFVRPQHAAEMAERIPDAQLAILPGTTHMSMLRRGAWLEPMLRERWAELSA